MKKGISLSIPNPCPEKWENFTSAAGGGFCSSCSKIVVDFTKKGDDEILEFFGARPTHACGRFRPDQLKQYSTKTPAVVRPGLTLLKAGFLSLLLIVMSRQVSAQTTPTKPKTEVAPRAGNETDQVVFDQRVSGIVRSYEDNGPLPCVNVLLKGSTTGTVTDAEGRFEFTESLKSGDVLVFCFIGLKTEEYVIPREANDGLHVSMELEMYYDMTGTVAVGVYEEKESGFRKLWEHVKAIF